MAKDYRTEYANDFISLNERYIGVEDYIKGMVKDGLIRSLIVNGPPGVGKTHSVKAYLDIHIGSENYKLMNGHCTLLSLYAKLYDFRDSGKVVVLDDVDSVFSKTDGLNILKAAMDTTNQRVIHWESPTHFLTTMEVPKSFEYNGSVILISNIGFGPNATHTTDESATIFIEDSENQSITQNNFDSVLKDDYFKISRRHAIGPLFRVGFEIVLMGIISLRNKMRTAGSKFLGRLKLKKSDG